MAEINTAVESGISGIRTAKAHQRRKRAESLPMPMPAKESKRSFTAAGRLPAGMEFSRP